MDWIDTLKTLAPTVATALGGPLAGAAVSAIGAALGVPPGSIAKAFQDGQLTPESVAKLRELEMQFQNDEKERGFKYAELEYKDRDSARTANTTGGIQNRLFVLSLMLLLMTLGAEGAVLFLGYPPGVPDVVIGRILGLADSVALMVLSYYYGTSSGSAQKTELLAGK
ncbi:hypothetical protein [Curvibacter gracilis]|uniref:hypothetical protein n=1 Tax=Curvibacter gracilis TaxID=230310 RepID=UPI0004895C4B|nr:hypothetical protein [Curvibacter gracilis]